MFRYSIYWLCIHVIYYIPLRSNIDVEYNNSNDSIFFENNIIIQIKIIHNYLFYFYGYRDLGNFFFFNWILSDFYDFTWKYNGNYNLLT